MQHFQVKSKKGLLSLGHEYSTYLWLLKTAMPSFPCSCSIDPELHLYRVGKKTAIYSNTFTDNYKCFLSIILAILLTSRLDINIEEQYVERQIIIFIGKS